MLTLHRIQPSLAGSNVDLDALPSDPVEEEAEGALIGINSEECALNGEASWGGHTGREVGVGGSREGGGGEQGGGEGCPEDDFVPVEWNAEKVETPFGVTDDIVSLRNGRTYYFFKLPHKVYTYVRMLQ